MGILLLRDQSSWSLSVSDVEGDLGLEMDGMGVFPRNRSSSSSSSSLSEYEGDLGLEADGMGSSEAVLGWNVDGLGWTVDGPGSSEELLHCEFLSSAFLLFLFQWWYLLKLVFRPMDAHTWPQRHGPKKRQLELIYLE